ncbi:MAG: Acetylornithine deacetylase/Succinyl-diaminopimelate desuccinylase [Gemmatimonadetes bacterium]|nr:Acetylornithine deacetylase/Succinyl-diaminopimelate desuccinylase [Gemmatimonadota bacterium]
MRRLRAQVHATDAQTLAEQLALVRIPAPTFHEGERARHVAERFRALGLHDVRTDEAGNVLARLPGSPAAPGGQVVVSAHLDTVFPAGTDVEPRHAGTRIHAPGITDNCRGLAGMLALARVLASEGVRTERPLVFAATVGEEGAGDLRGVKHLFREGGELRRAGAFVALDGSGVRRIVHRAIGSRRLRVEVAGPGGHSWADRGTPNPVGALGRAVAAVAGMGLPSPARSSVTVARIAGGTSINAIPDAAWMEVDLRSEVPDALAEIERLVRSHVERAVAAENARRRPGAAALACAVTLIGDRPSGETPASAELVRAAMAVTSALGERPELVASSTDANLAISLGIPAVCIGVGGDSGGIHTLDEWYSDEKGALGVERALLVALAAARLART